MGIFINLYIIPQRILAEEWRQVYQESLKLVDAYGFMDRVGARRNGLQYFYAERTREREDLWGRGRRGWHSIGDMRTGANTEDYVLYEEIGAYLPGRPTEDNGADILLHRLYHMKGIEKPNCCVNIWGNKSQGEDSHIYLLAIACLIVDRFPDAAMVSGDISAGQCRRAVRWANQYLEEPIHLPHTAQMEKLLPRLRRTSIPEKQLLEAFYSLTEEMKNSKMGDFLRREFDREEWYKYYRRRFGECQTGQRGFVTNMKEYLEMGFGFEELCRIAVTDPEGMQAKPEEFLKRVMESKLYLEEKETRDFTRTARENADREEADSIGGLFVSVLGTLCGAENRNVAAFYPLERIRDDCKRVFGDRCDVDAVIDGILAEAAKDAEAAKVAETAKDTKDTQNAAGESGSPGRNSMQALLYDDPDSIARREAERMEERRQRERLYDINSYRELIDFAPGCSVKPELEEDLIRNFKLLHRFAEGGFEEFRVFNKEERENFFIRGNRNILLRKEVWDRIFDRMMDDAYIMRFYGLFCVDCSRLDGYNFCKNLSASLQALDYYWEKTIA